MPVADDDGAYLGADPAGAGACLPFMLGGPEIGPELKY